MDEAGNVSLRSAGGKATPAATAKAKPTVSTIDITSTPRLGVTYAKGETITFSVTFSDKVKVPNSGCDATLEIEIGGVPNNYYASCTRARHRRDYAQLGLHRERIGHRHRRGERPSQRPRGQNQGQGRRSERHPGPPRAEQPDQSQNLRAGPGRAHGGVRERRQLAQQRTLLHHWERRSISPCDSTRTSGPSATRP